jgi:predicted small lipoprotein YifL
MKSIVYLPPFSLSLLLAFSTAACGQKGTAVVPSPTPSTTASERSATTEKPIVGSNNAETKTIEPASTEDSFNAAVSSYTEEVQQLIQASLTPLESKSVTLKMIKDGSHSLVTVSFHRSVGGLWEPDQTVEVSAASLTLKSNKQSPETQPNPSATPSRQSSVATPPTIRKVEEASEKSNKVVLEGTAPKVSINPSAKARWVEDASGRKKLIMDNPEASSEPSPAAPDKPSITTLPTGEGSTSGGHWMEVDGRKVFVPGNTDPAPSNSTAAESSQTKPPVTEEQKEVTEPKTAEELTKGRWVEKDGRKVFQADP